MSATKKYAKMDGMYLVPMKKPPGRPPKLGKVQKQVNVRLPDDMVKALDAYGERHGDGDEKLCVSDCLREIARKTLVREGLLKPN